MVVKGKAIAAVAIEAATISLGARLTSILQGLGVGVADCRLYKAYAADRGVRSAQVQDNVDSFTQPIGIRPANLEELSMFSAFHSTWRQGRTETRASIRIGISKWHPRVAWVRRA
jgi:hypothetical protein